MNKRFFKTGPGQYGEGDLFLGVSVPHTRKVAAVHAKLSLPQIKSLLRSPYHEDRLLALILLVNQYQELKNQIDRKKWVGFYLTHRNTINNWDLVDTSAHHILGDYCLRTQSTTILKKLSRSSRHWDKRIAIVGTFAFIRQGKISLTFELAKSFLTEKEDLMHKATGWMLREAGKRDKLMLQKFISMHGKRMPRTMLRYAIERFAKAEQKRILTRTRA